MIANTDFVRSLLPFTPRKFLAFIDAGKERGEEEEKGRGVEIEKDFLILYRMGC